jgi:hypothetical protein
MTVSGCRQSDKTFGNWYISSDFQVNQGARLFPWFLVVPEGRHDSRPAIHRRFRDATKECGASPGGTAEVWCFLSIFRPSLRDPKRRFLLLPTDPAINRLATISRPSRALTRILAHHRTALRSKEKQSIMKKAETQQSIRPNLPRRPFTGYPRGPLG